MTRSPLRTAQETAVSPYISSVMTLATPVPNKSRTIPVHPFIEAQKS